MDTDQSEYSDGQDMLTIFGVSPDDVVDDPLCHLTLFQKPAGTGTPLTPPPATPVQPPPAKRPRGRKGSGSGGVGPDYKSAGLKKQDRVSQIQTQFEQEKVPIGLSPRGGGGTLRSPMGMSPLGVSPKTGFAKFSLQDWTKHVRPLQSDQTRAYHKRIEQDLWVRMVLHAPETAPSNRTDTAASLTWPIYKNLKNAAPMLHTIAQYIDPNNCNAKTIPWVPYAYELEFRRECCNSNLERECIYEEDCVGTWLAQRIDPHGEPGFVLREFFLPDDWKEVQRTKKLPEIRNMCLLCNQYYTTLKYYETLHEGKNATNVYQTHRNFIDQPGEYRKEVAIYPDNSIFTGIVDAFVKFEVQHYRFHRNANGVRYYVPVDMDF